MSMLERVTRFLSRTEGRAASSRGPVLSCVVIVHDMMDQAENTVKSLLCDYQRGIQPHEYEVVIVENASPRVMRREFTDSPNSRPPPPPSKICCLVGSCRPGFA